MEEFSPVLDGDPPSLGIFVPRFSSDSSRLEPTRARARSRSRSPRVSSDETRAAGVFYLSIRTRHERVFVERTTPTRGSRHVSYHETRRNRFRFDDRFSRNDNFRSRDEGGSSIAHFREEPRLLILHRRASARISKRSPRGDPLDRKERLSSALKLFRTCRRGTTRAKCALRVAQQRPASRRLVSN